MANITKAPGMPGGPDRSAENYAPIKRSLRRQKKFLQVLAKTGKVAHAAKLAGYADTSTLYKIRKLDEAFDRAWIEAEDASSDLLEDEAVRRGLEGVDKPVFYKGQIVGYEKLYSDGMLQFVLRSRRPDKFRENVEVTSTVNHNIGIAVVPLTAPRLEDWQRAALEVQDNQRLLNGDDAKPIEVVGSPTLVRR